MHWVQAVPIVSSAWIAVFQIGVRWLFASPASLGQEIPANSLAIFSA